MEKFEKNPERNFRRFLDDILVGIPKQYGSTSETTIDYRPIKILG